MSGKVAKRIRNAAKVALVAAATAVGVPGPDQIGVPEKPMTMADIALNYFTPYQSKWINDESRLKLCEKSRRIGMTYATSFRRVYKAMTTPGLDCWVSTRDLTSAKEFIRYCGKWCQIAGIVAVGINGDSTVEVALDDAAKITAQVIHFPNGARIFALTSNPNALASKGGDLVLDEFALHLDQETLWQVAKPSATVWGYQIEVISTHRGKNTVFNGFVLDAKGKNKFGWSLHTIDIVSAANNGLVDRINAATAKRGIAPQTPEQFVARERATCRTEADWLQEYMCQPTEQFGSLITYSMYDACKMPAAELYAAEIKGPCYVGMDIGRRKDLSVIWVLEDLGTVLATRLVVTLENMKFRDQLNELIDICERFNVRAGRIDGQGIGMQIAEDAEADIGSHIQGVDMTIQAKSRIATLMLTVYQDGCVQVPDDDRIRESVHKVEKAVSPSGMIRYVAPRDEDGHADEFWAQGLAVDAARSGDGFVAGMRVVEERGAGLVPGDPGSRMCMTAAEQDAVDEYEDATAKRGAELW